VVDGKAMLMQTVRGVCGFSFRNVIPKEVVQMKKSVLMLIILSMLAMSLTMIPSPARAADDLVVTSAVEDSTVGPGDHTNVLLGIVNSSSSTVQDITLYVEEHQYITTEVSPLDVGNLAGGSSTTLNVPITISDSADDGDYILDAELRYRYRDLFLWHNETEDVRIPITIGESYQVQINRYTFSHEPVKPGDDFTLSVWINNEGSSSARDIIVLFGYEVAEEVGTPPSEIPGELLPQEYLERIVKADTSFITQSSPVAFIKNLDPGSPTAIDFFLSSEDSVGPGTHTVPLLLFYHDINGNLYPSSIEEVRLEMAVIGLASVEPTGDIILDIAGKKVTSASGEDGAKVGETFSVSVTIRNEGTTTAENVSLLLSYETTQTSGTAVQPEMQVILDQLSGALPSGIVDQFLAGNMGIASTDVPFTPVTDFVEVVGVLAPNEEKTVIFELEAGRSAETKMYTVPISILYQNSQGIMGSVNNAVGIKLTGDAIFGIAGRNTDPSTVRKGDSYTLEIQIENIGTTQARSVRVVLDNGVDDFLGSMEPWDVGIAMFDLDAVDDGVSTMHVTVQYLDEDQQLQSQELAIEVNVHAEQDNTIYWVIFGIVAVAAVILIVVIMKRRGGGADDEEYDGRGDSPWSPGPAMKASMPVSTPQSQSSTAKDSVWVNEQPGASVEESKSLQQEEERQNDESQAEAVGGVEEGTEAARWRVNVQ